MKAYFLIAFFALVFCIQENQGRHHRNSFKCKNPLTFEQTSGTGKVKLTCCPTRKGQRFFCKLAAPPASSPSTSHSHQKHQGPGEHSPHVTPAPKSSPHTVTLPHPTQGPSVAHLVQTTSAAGSPHTVIKLPNSQGPVVPTEHKAEHLPETSPVVKTLPKPTSKP